ncbi:MAG TPA: Hsp70 family protein, partial [Gemmataceae bacterium]|nr:Hsp70 family protein [Gemmataceae bacterium]
VLTEKHLEPGDIEKVVLVGGPTLTPYLRQRLADRAEGLGIPLEFGVDPMTIVARGAALFAATQRLEQTAPVEAGQFALQLEYQPVGADPEPLVGGKVLPPAGQDLTGFTIEFFDADMRPPWRSGQIRLGADGYFEATLLAEKGRLNTFLIELHDQAGRKCVTVPDRLTYTLGAALTEPPLIHSLGVALANNEMQVIIPKGTALPARKRVVHQTASVIRKGQSGDRIRIPVIEGENVRRADRNRLIGALEIRSEDLQRDVPALSDIEITIEIDSSRLLRAWAYIPVLDEEYGQVLKFHQGEPQLEVLRQEVEQEKRRLGKARRKADELGDQRATRVLGRIDHEEILQDLLVSLDAAANDADAADKCQNRLLDLKSAIDEVEYALEWPALQVDARARMAELRDLVDREGTSRDKQRAEVLEREVQQAIQAEDADLLWRQIKEVQALTTELYWRQPEFLYRLLLHLETWRSDMRDQALAARLLQLGTKAAEERDLSGLRSALHQLIGLLPPERRGHLTGYGGTTLL